MEFSDNKPIYRQIVEICRDRILSGEWKIDDRIPSTKELALTLTVNNRTIMKAFDELADAGIIYQRRGMGYYVSADAVTLIARNEREVFMNETLPAFADQMRRLGLTVSDIAADLPQ